MVRMKTITRDLEEMLFFINSYDNTEYSEEENVVILKGFEKSLTISASLMDAIKVIDEKKFRNQFLERTLMVDYDGKICFYRLILHVEKNKKTGILTKKGETKIEDSRLEKIKYILNKSTIFTISNDKGIVLEANDHFYEITGYSEQEVIGNTHELINSGYHPETFFKEIRDTIGKGRVWQGEIKSKKKCGKRFWVDATVIPIEHQDGVAKRIITVRSDITEKKKAEKLINHMAFHDELTNLPNRRLLNEEIDKLIIEEKPFSVLFIDLDNFKKINDSFGHDVGDCYLKEIAKRFKKTIADNGIVSRRGGDEFTILVREAVDPKEISKMIEKIQKDFKKPIYCRKVDDVTYISLSIGISCYPKDYKQKEGLLKASELAMYESKKRGKGQAIYYDKVYSDQSKKERYLESNIRKAVQKKEFTLHFQPQIDFNTNGIVGVEGLMRWKKQGGYISPALFIPVLESTGLIREMGYWVIEEACKKHVQWVKKGFKPVEMSVNVSMKQLEQEDFPKEVKRIIMNTGIDARYLKIEITESIMAEGNETMKRLAMLKKIGVKIAIDDFGKGYSSLSYLKDLPIDTLKIDKSFIDEIEKKEKVSRIVKGIIELGHGLDLKVVAEGIEKKEQEVVLKELGCDIGQGYYYQRPVPGDKFEELLQ